MSDLVQIQSENGITRLTLNRPKALNALNVALLVALEEAIDDLANDTALRCVIITGSGTRAFVAGADIGEMAGLNAAEANYFSAMGHRVLSKIEALPVPVIAAVNGFALGGGCELSLACDIVYAADNARFGQPEVKLGLIPGFGGTQRLARRVGAMRALELVTTARVIRAAEAKAIGLCIDVVPGDELMAKVEKVAAMIAAQAPIAVRVAKAVQAKGLDGTLAEGNVLEQEAFGGLFETADTKEGLAAFLEKRGAVFRGE